MTPDRQQTYAALMEQRLASVYRESVLGQVSYKGSARLFRELVQSDQELRAVCADRRKELGKINPRKCFISDQHRGFLDAALA